MAIIYGRTLTFNFVYYDDNVFVFENPQVKAGLTGHGIVYAFTDGPLGWWPMAVLSQMLDCQLYGATPAGAWGHHLTSVLLHAATAIGLFLVLRSMTGEPWPSAFVAALFAVHPQNVEGVVWIAERREVLSGFFFVLTLAAYLGYVRHGRSIGRYLLRGVLPRVGADVETDFGYGSDPVAIAGLLAAGAVRPGFLQAAVKRSAVRRRSRQTDAPIWQRRQFGASGTHPTGSADSELLVAGSRKTAAAGDRRCRFGADGRLSSPRCQHGLAELADALGECLELHLPLPVAPVLSGRSTRCLPFPQRRISQAVDGRSGDPLGADLRGRSSSGDARIRICWWVGFGFWECWCRCPG